MKPDWENATVEKRLLCLDQWLIRYIILETCMCRTHEVGRSSEKGADGVVSMYVARRNLTGAASGTGMAQQPPEGLYSMPHDEKRIFVSCNKRKKEVVLLIMMGIGCAGLSLLILTGVQLSIAAWIAYIITIISTLIIIRSIKYRQIRVEIKYDICDIYAGDKLLSRIEIASISYCSYGPGGLRVKFSRKMPLTDRLKLASLFLHFFGLCIDRAILPNGLFPSISDVATRIAAASSQQLAAQVAGSRQH